MIVKGGLCNGHRQFGNNGKVCKEVGGSKRMHLTDVAYTPV
jgi:hypothetical protein